MNDYEAREGGPETTEHGSWECDSTCPSCDGETVLTWASGGEEIHTCVSEHGCGEFDEDGESVYDGPSDYSERMHERRQMGLCAF
jgi:hypothetical protein